MNETIDTPDKEELLRIIHAYVREEKETLTLRSYTNVRAMNETVPKN